MKKKSFRIILIVMVAFIGVFGGYQLYQYIRVLTAKIEVTTVSNLTLEYASKVKVSELISSINGEITDDYEIDTSKLGQQEIKFDFVNDDGIPVSYTFEVTVEDTEEPLIWLGNTYYTTVGSDLNLTDKVLCGDNEDDTPVCVVEGNYDLNTPGNYELVFKATDKSGNETEQPFTLIVEDPEEELEEENQEEQPEPEIVYTEFQDVVDQYKNENTEIGVDLSSFQGDVDFEKLKEAGVEFVMIRVGSRRGIDTDFFLDSQFQNNIKNANKYGIKAGVYFYSYAASIEDAKKEAQWVLKQIKNYDIELPIAFDWENWSYYNDYHLSFFNLTSMAESFVDEVEKAGYDGMIYSSKTYLENMWMPLEDDVWLAHYTDTTTTYQGDYKMWQLCENGKVDGISGMVDINILYLDK